MSERAKMSTESNRRVFLHVLGATSLVACGGRPGDAQDDGTASDPDPAVTGTGPGSGDDAAPLPAGECGGIDVGAVETFAPGHDLHLFGSGRNTLIIANDDGSAPDTTGDGSAQPGLFAMSALCTHARCPVQVRSSQWYCHCHGARFDFFGKTLSSVARHNLPRYAVSVCNGHVFVDTSHVVDANTRVPV